MGTGRSLPVDPLGFIERCVRLGHVYWTYHVNVRLVGRFIDRRTLLGAIDTYEIVEAYPEDKYLPSYLVLGHAGNDSFHILFAADVDADQVRIVTAYRPDLRDWLPDLKTRRPAR